MRPTSGETTVSMRHLVFVTPCGWLSVNQKVIYTGDKYQVSHIAQ